MACSVLVVDDVAGMRVLWRAILEEHPDIIVVGEAADGEGALKGVRQLQPDVLLLDLSMPGRDGLEVIPAVPAASPRTAVVVASGFSASRMARTALELGAAAYFEKGAPSEQLVRVVLAACGASSRR